MEDNMAKRRNPSNLMLLENPYSFDYLGNLHPYKKHRSKKMRNPLVDTLPGIGKYTQNVSMMDAAAGLIGFAAAGWVPGLIVKNPTTTGTKLAKIAVALGATIGTGMLVKRMSRDAAKAAVIGGLAGTIAMTLSTFTSIKIPGMAGIGVRPAPIISAGQVSGLGRVNEPEFVGTKLR
jgi:hypothetical protein